MTLSTLMLAGSILSLVMMAIGFVWLKLRGKMVSERMSDDDAKEFMQDGTLGDQNGITIAKGFKGKAWGMSMGAEIETYQVLQMVKAGNWHEALPWLVPIIGALLAFFFWPMWICLICGMDPWLALAFTSVFVYTAIRAAWPVKPPPSHDE
jgi:hypothetical protein